MRPSVTLFGRTSMQYHMPDGHHSIKSTCIGSSITAAEAKGSCIAYFFFMTTVWRMFSRRLAGSETWL
jgi:hypothetical protein